VSRSEWKARSRGRNDVRRLLGTPREIVTFEQRNEEVWTWPYLQFSGYMLFHVHFDRSSGTVGLILRLEDLDYSGRRLNRRASGTGIIRDGQGADDRGRAVGADVVSPEAAA
jgi:hypothetical protein